MRRICRSSAARCRSTAFRVFSRGCRALRALGSGLPSASGAGALVSLALRSPSTIPTVLALARRRGAVWLDTTGTQLGRADLPEADQQEAGPWRFFSLAELNTAIRARLDRPPVRPEGDRRRACRVRPEHRRRAAAAGATARGNCRIRDPRRLWPSPTGSRPAAADQNLSSLQPIGRFVAAYNLARVGALSRW
jgi:hypothetical protein